MIDGGRQMKMHRKTCYLMPNRSCPGETRAAFSLSAIVIRSIGNLSIFYSITTRLLQTGSVVWFLEPVNWKEQENGSGTDA